MASKIRQSLLHLSFLLALFFVPSGLSAQKTNDSEWLGKALDYFQSGKYHEALIIFQRLDKEYELNNRFKAYIGLCYYYEWDYKHAAQYLTAAIPHLELFSPHERSVYNFSAAESFFNLKLYPKAIPYYIDALGLCYANERGEILYRLGLCYMFQQQWQQAYQAYDQAQTELRAHNNPAETASRLAQISNMLAACKRNYLAIKAQQKAKEKAKTEAGENLKKDSISVPSTKNLPSKVISPIDLNKLFEQKMDIQLPQKEAK